ncbi:MAG: glutamine synthetase, partial [Mobilicoccus sp.]|nr:glutamine synthetase [Mobilicoccus sp.]
MFQDADELLGYLEENDVETVDVRFCDLPGVMQHFTIPARFLTRDVIEDGLSFDGSSIRG